MKTFVVLTGILIVGAIAWLIGSRLSADALGMALGISLCVLAGVPTALLLLAAGRRGHGEAETDEEALQVRRIGPGYAAYPHQAPVIVLAQPAAPWQPPPGQVDYGSQPIRGALPGPTAPASSGRVFRMVGEREELIEEF
jgi:hypothetical protein